MTTEEKIERAMQKAMETAPYALEGTETERLAAKMLLTLNDQNLLDTTPQSRLRFVAACLDASKEQMYLAPSTATA